MGHEALCAPAGLQAAGEGAPPTGDPRAEEPSAPIAALGAAAPPSGNLHMGTASEKWEVGATQAARPLGGAHRNLGAQPRPEPPHSAPSLTRSFRPRRGVHVQGRGWRGAARAASARLAPGTPADTRASSSAPATTCQVSLPGPSPSTGGSPPFDLEACIPAQDTEAAASPPSGSCIGRQGAKAGAVSAVSPPPGVLGKARGRAGLLAAAARPAVAREGPSVTLWGVGHCLHTVPR